MLVNLLNITKNEEPTVLNMGLAGFLYVFVSGNAVLLSKFVWNSEFLRYQMSSNIKSNRLTV